MQCPYCGFGIADERAPVCPNCGRYLAATPASSSTSMAPSPGMSSEQPSSLSTQNEQVDQPTPSNQPNTPYSPYPAYPGYSTYPGPENPNPSGYPPSYGQSGAPSQGFLGGYPPSYGPYGQYGQSAPPSQGFQGYPPSYGQAAGPSQGFLPGYGQPGAPSQGYLGYPYGYPSAYSQPMPGMPGAPAVPQKKSGGAGVVISIILAVVVVLALVMAGGLALLHSQGSTANIATGNNTPGTGATTTATTSSTGTAEVFNDPLTSNVNGWANAPQKCFFAADGYHVENGYTCFAPTTIPDNFTAQVDVKEIRGPTNQPFGLSFRRTSKGNEYFFDLDGYGHWSVDKCVNNTCSLLVPWSHNVAAIHSGLKVKNTIEVEGKGSQFTFLVNGTKVGQITDATYSSGDVGLSSALGLEAVYTNIIINQILG